MYRDCAHDHSFNSKCCHEVQRRLRSGDRAICVSGHAGSGKTTVVRRALDKCGLLNKAVEVSVFGCQTEDEILMCLLSNLGSRQYPTEVCKSQREFLLASINFPPIIVLINSALDLTASSVFREVDSVMVCVHTLPQPAPGLAQVSYNPNRVYTEQPTDTCCYTHTLAYGLLRMYRSIFCDSPGPDMSRSAACESAADVIVRLLESLSVVERALIEGICHIADGHVQFSTSVIFNGELPGVEEGTWSLSELERGLVGLHNKYLVTVRESDGKCYVEVGNTIVSEIRRNGGAKKYVSSQQLVRHYLPNTTQSLSFDSNNPLQSLQQLPYVTDDVVNDVVACCCSTESDLAAVATNLLTFNACCLTVSVVEDLLKRCSPPIAEILSAHLSLEAESRAGEQLVPQLEIQRAVHAIGTITSSSYIPRDLALMKQLNRTNRVFATQHAIKVILSEESSELGCSKLFNYPIELKNIEGDRSLVLQQILKRLSSFRGTDALHEFEQLLRRSSDLASETIPFIIRNELSPAAMPVLSGDLDCDFQSIAKYVGNKNPTCIKSGGVRMLHALRKLYATVPAADLPAISEFPTDLQGEVVCPKLGCFLLQICSENGLLGEEYLTQCDGLNELLVPCVQQGSYTHLRILSKRSGTLSLGDIEKVLDSDTAFMNNDVTTSLFQAVVKKCTDHDGLVSILMKRGKQKYLPSGMRELCLSTCHCLLKQGMYNDSEDACRALSTQQSLNLGFLTDLCDSLWPQPADELVRYPNSPVVVIWGGVDWDLGSVSSFFGAPSGLRKLMDLYDGRSVVGSVFCHPVRGECSEPFWEISSKKTTPSSSRLFMMHAPFLHFGVLASGAALTKPLVCSSILGLPEDVIVTHFMSLGPTAVPYWVAFTRSEDDEKTLRSHLQKTIMTRGINRRYLREYFLSRNELLMIFKSLPQDLGNAPTAVIMKIFHVIQLNIDVESGSSVLAASLKLLRTASGCRELLVAVTELLGNTELTGDIVANVLRALPGMTFCDEAMIAQLCKYVCHHSEDVRKAFHELLHRSTLQKRQALEKISTNMSDAVCDALAYLDNTDHLSLAITHRFTLYVIEQCALVDKKRSLPHSDLVTSEYCPPLNPTYFNIIEKLSLDNQEVVAKEISRCQDMVERGMIGCSIRLIGLVPDLSLMSESCRNDCLSIALDDEAVLRLSTRFRAVQELMQRSTGCIVSTICNRLQRVKDPVEYSRLLACLNPTASLPRSVIPILENIAESGSTLLARRALQIVAPDAVTKNLDYFFDICG